MVSLIALVLALMSSALVLSQCSGTTTITDLAGVSALASASCTTFTGDIYYSGVTLSAIPTYSINVSQTTSVQSPGPTLALDTVEYIEGTLSYNDITCSEYVLAGEGAQVPGSYFYLAAPRLKNVSSYLIFEDIGNFNLFFPHFSAAYGLSLRNLSIGIGALFGNGINTTIQNLQVERTPGPEAVTIEPLGFLGTNEVEIVNQFFAPDLGIFAVNNPQGLNITWPGQVSAVYAVDNGETFVNLPDAQNVSLYVSNCRNLSAPSLSQIHSNFLAANEEYAHGAPLYQPNVSTLLNNSFTRLNLPALVDGYYLALQSNPQLETLTFPQLTGIAEWNIEANDNLHELDFPRLSAIDILNASGTFTAVSFPALSSAEVISVRSSRSLDCSSLQRLQHDEGLVSDTFECEGNLDLQSSTPSSTETSGPAQQKGHENGSDLSEGGKIGIGVGVGVGGAIVICLVTGFVLLFRMLRIRQSPTEKETEAARQAPDTERLEFIEAENPVINEADGLGLVEVGTHGFTEVDAQRLVELDAERNHELASESNKHELPVDPTTEDLSINQQRHELPMGKKY